MRSRPDADLWGGLRDHGRRDGDRRPRRASSLPPEARGRLLDAALGMLASVRTALEVAEEVLEERRDRIVHGGDRGPWVRDPDDAPRSGASPPDEDEGVVRDIPFSGS